MNIPDSKGKTDCDRDALFAIKLCKFITWTVGIWPLHCDDLFSWIRCCASIIFQSVLVLDQLMVMINNCGAFDYFIDEMVSELCSIMGILKVITVRVYKKEISNIICSVINICFNTKDARSIEILKPFMKFGTWVTFMQMVLAYITVILFLIRPFIEPIRAFISGINNNTDWNATLDSQMVKLPLHSECIYPNLQTDTYIVMCIMEIIGLFMCGHSNVGMSVFFLLLTMILSGHFAVLKQDVTKINTKLKERDKLEEEIHSLFQRHSKLLDLADILNKTVSEVLLVELLMNCTVNLVLGMRLLIALKLGETVIRVIMTFSVLMFQIFLLNYVGETLTNQTDSVRDSLCDINWYELRPKTKKTLCFMIMRANKPVYRLAGRFYVLNYEHFKNILKACFSLFNIFRLMFEV